MSESRNGKLKYLLIGAVLIIALFGILFLIVPEKVDEHAGQVFINDGFEDVWMTPYENVPASALTREEFRTVDKEMKREFGRTLNELKNAAQETIDRLRETVGEQGADPVVVDQRTGEGCYVELVGSLLTARLFGIELCLKFCQCLVAVLDMIQLLFQVGLQFQQFGHGLHAVFLLQVVDLVQTVVDAV